MLEYDQPREGLRNCTEDWMEREVILYIGVDVYKRQVLAAVQAFEPEICVVDADVARFGSGCRGICSSGLFRALLQGVQLFRGNPGAVVGDDKDDVIPLSLIHIFC